MAERLNALDSCILALRQVGNAMLGKLCIEWGTEIPSRDPFFVAYVSKKQMISVQADYLLTVIVQRKNSFFKLIHNSQIGHADRLLRFCMRFRAYITFKIPMRWRISSLLLDIAVIENRVIISGEALNLFISPQPFCH